MVERLTEDRITEVRFLYWPQQIKRKYKMSKYLESRPAIRNVGFDYDGRVKNISVGFVGLKDQQVHFRFNKDSAIVSVKGPRLFKQNYSKNATRKAELLRNRAQAFITHFMEEQQEAVRAMAELSEVKELSLV